MCICTRLKYRKYIEIILYEQINDPLIQVIPLKIHNFAIIETSHPIEYEKNCIFYHWSGTDKLLHDFIR